MSPQEKFQRFVTQYPHSRGPFYARPHFTRRQLFQIFGAGVTATCMIGKPAPAGVVVNSNPVSTQNTAKNVIFIYIGGGPSTIDMFDPKPVLMKYEESRRHSRSRRSTTTATTITCGPRAS